MKLDQAALILHLSSSGQMQSEFSDQNKPVVRRCRKTSTHMCTKKLQTKVLHKKKIIKGTVKILIFNNFEKCVWDELGD